MSNKKGAFLSLAVNCTPIEEREPTDFYATHPQTVKIFLDKLKQDEISLPHRICEPACGMGHISKVLQDYGYKVVSYDLYNHGWGHTGVDFLKSDIKAECFFTNPPYKYALEFVQKALENVAENGYVIMLLKVQFLESKERYEFFKKYPPKYVYINSSRQKCSRNGEFDKYKANTICYAWFIWQKGFNGEPVIRWIR